jgi:hypothetical protein
MSHKPLGRHGLEEFVVHIPPPNDRFMVLVSTNDVGECLKEQAIEPPEHSDAFA